MTYLCNGVTGYDGPTGLGTPNGVNAFVTPTTLTVSGFPNQTVAGVAHNLTVKAATHRAVSYPAISARSTSPAPTPKAVLPADYTFTSADAGMHVFSVTLKTNGTQSLTATDTSNSSIKGTERHRGGLAVLLTAISPRRILDTRATVKSGNPTNIGLSGMFKAGTVRQFSVAGAKYVGGGTAPAVPANAVAVTGNLTVVNETAAGVIDLGPAASASGTTSTLSFVKGDTRANNVTVGLAADGTLAAVYRSPYGRSHDEPDLRRDRLLPPRYIRCHLPHPDPRPDPRHAQDRQRRCHPHRPAVKAGQPRRGDLPGGRREGPGLDQLPWCPRPRWRSPAT